MKLRPIHLMVIMVLTASVVTLWPGAGERLIYDRSALARGEWWRWMTGHWVHYSVSHLLFDALALLVGAQFLRGCSTQLLFVTLTASAGAISFTLFCWQPELVRYAGLSGLALTVLTLAAVDNLQAGGPSRPVGLLVLVVIVAKLAVESSTGGFLFAAIDRPGVEPATLAHAVGAVVGVLGGFMPRPAPVVRAGVSSNQQSVI